MTTDSTTEGIDPVFTTLTNKFLDKFFGREAVLTPPYRYEQDVNGCETYVVGIEWVKGDRILTIVLPGDHGDRYGTVILPKDASPAIITLEDPSPTRRR
jgi:hypothetical protein